MNDMRSPTIRDVAKHAKVSVATVSRVINGSPQVRTVTRDRVLESIEQLGFQPNSAAQRLSGGKTHTIGVISPFFTRPAFAHRLAGIQEILDVSNYDLVLYSIRSLSPLTERFGMFINQNRVDGLITISVHIPEKLLLESPVELPVVTLDDERVENFPSIVIDNILGGRMATEYLIAKGHRKIGFIGDVDDSVFNFVSSQRRFEGFQQIIHQENLPFNPNWHAFGKHGAEVAHQNGLNVLSQEDRPSAIFVASDTQAYGVLKASEELGLRVPDDIAIIGFDDIESSQYMNLTTIRAHMGDSGKLSAEYLLDWLRQGYVEEDRWRTFLPLEVVPRNSA